MGTWEDRAWGSRSMGAWSITAGTLAAWRQLHGQLPGAKTAKASSMGKREKGLHAGRAYSKGKFQAYPQRIGKDIQIGYCCNR